MGQRNNGETFVNHMNTRRHKNFAHESHEHYGVYQPDDRNSQTAIFYNRAKLGVVHPLASLTRTQSDPNKDLRSAAGIYVPLLELVFLNVWLDHADSKVKPLESLDSHL